MSNSIKHSKFKNTGILFELLVRQVTADILSANDTNKANKILHKFFNEATELGKELKLYQLMTTQKAKDSVSADRILETILKARKRISKQKLQEQKYNLIKTIKENYPIDQFLKGTISNYKLLASVYKLFEDCCNDNEFVNAEDVIQSRLFISENLLRNSNVLTQKTKDENSQLLEFYKNQEDDLRLLSYKILVDKFNEKYSALNMKQQTLLREYINNVSNTNMYIDSEIPKVKAELTMYKNKIADNVVKIKLSETINQLERLSKGSIVKDSQITSLLISYELIKELKNVTNG